MLLNSIIRNLLGIKRHVAKSVTGDTKAIVVKLDQRRLWRLPCSGCGRFGRVRGVEEDLATHDFASFWISFIIK